MGTHPADTITDRLIDVELPARTEVMATLRVLTASLAADVGCTIDEIDDLRLAISEVFSCAVTSETERVTVSFRPSPDRLQVQMARSDGAPIALDPLAVTVLDALVDFSQLGDVISMSKRAEERKS